MSENVKERMIELQKIIKMKNINDFRMWEYKDLTLKIVASFDFAYYHDVEIIFYDVSFVSCPTVFIDAKIRLGTNEERELLLKAHNIRYMEDEDILFCFTTDDDDKYYILADRFDFNKKVVLY